MGDDGRYRDTRIGTVTFQSDSSNPFILKYFMHVSGLKNNLVSFVVLDDLGYDVVFSEGKVFLCNKSMGKVEKIGVRVKNLYKIDVDGCATLSSKTD